MFGHKQSGRSERHPRFGGHHAGFHSADPHSWGHHRGGDRSIEGRRQGRGGRRGRYANDALRIVLLGLIADTPRHGYDLIRAIEETTGGVWAPRPFMVYPTLTLLNEMGLIEEQPAEAGVRRFAITPQGRAHLEDQAVEVSAIFERLGVARGRSEAVPIRRAMHNLRNVLGHRLGDGLGGDVLSATVALIDETAQKIERL